MQIRMSAPQDLDHEVEIGDTETWIRTRITVYIAAVDHADQDVCPTRFRPRGGDR